ncbi:acyl-CoA thioesterase FadM [Amaricoccus macauensis]|uniref:Acyl-CoA thioesterase FadM n=1 Tax=Amaricoccus macauensis TaxID=57001 RepID=A0A840SBY8_9RHOB|nr:thioesterase family protein [Amaricoccus macauensis]MBB5220289.1 acyl-CoA thioesterase FadM [Amaricoccus macauensis]
MYPFFRFALETTRARSAGRLPLGGTHVSHHRCWPWDLDPWIELNNGRTLTLYDLGRIPLAIRMGLYGALRENRWGITVAGSSVRYRRRVRAFQRIEMRSAFVGRDARFLYIHQAMFDADSGDALSSVLVRSAVTSPQGIVPTDRVIAAIGRGDALPAPPPWVAAWAAADAERPWPPEFA